MVNPDRPWPRPETPRPALDATTSETLELWASQPEWDLRSLEEFAAEGGRPVGPPNRSDPADGMVAAVSWMIDGFLSVFRFFRRLLDFRRSAIDHALENEDRWGRTIPPRPMLIPPPPPPSTPMITGYLRSSLPKAPVGGTGETRREDRRALRDELPPIYPEEDDGPIDAGGCLIFPFPRNVRPTLSMAPPPPDSGGTLKR